MVPLKVASEDLFSSSDSMVTRFAPSSSQLFKAASQGLPGNSRIRRMVLKANITIVIIVLLGFHETMKSKAQDS
jgi:hypothetical protein